MVTEMATTVKDVLHSPPVPKRSNAQCPFRDLYGVHATWAFCFPNDVAVT